MREIRYAAVNGKEIPVLISDENEALLAARAAGGAIVGLWSGEGRGTAAPYAVEALSEDVYKRQSFACGLRLAALLVQHGL